MSTLLPILSLCVAFSNLEEGQRLYDEALYEEALRALGERCEPGVDEIRCEELRGFLLIGIQREDDAANAFERMVVLDPTVELSQEVAPKIRSVFEAAKATIDRLTKTTLEPVRLQDDDLPTPLKVVPPSSARLTAVTVHLSPEEGQPFTPISLSQEGDGWVGMAKIDPDDAEEARYYLEFRLSSGGTLDPGETGAVGLSIAPKGSVADGGGSGSGATDWLKKHEDDPGSDDELLPTWAWWAIAGGGAAVVTGVILAFALSGDDGAGNVQVGVTFNGDP